MQVSMPGSARSTGPTTDRHAMYERIQACRSCACTELETVLDLGPMPLVDRLVPQADLTAPEPRVPLTVAVCRGCGLMQILETVDPRELFCQDYPYYSSCIPALCRHARASVDELIGLRRLGSRSLVVELASNDGYLLQHYREQGVPVLGIDPAQGPARAAQQRGIPTLNRFFTTRLARRLRREGRRADVIHANNVLAHVPDLNGFVRGIATLLKEDGVAVIECPYVADLVGRCEFDTIYHEHLCYFSVTALRSLFARHGLWLNAVRPLRIHGGSLRLFVSRRSGENDSVHRLLAREAADGFGGPHGYRRFGGRVSALRMALNALLGRLKREGATIAAYGAAAKGATLINYAGIGRTVLDFVVDRNPHKQGRFMPGQHLPIVAPEHLLAHRPDYTLLLAWNFQDEILEQQRPYLDTGGRFIVPVPEPRIL